MRGVALAALALAGIAGAAAQPLPVVTTTTDLKSLVEAVGGERVSVASIVPAGGGGEEYQPRPQDLARLKAARLVARVGVDYDLWLDRLLAQAAIPALQRGGPAYVDASFGIALLEVRGASVGPADGHAHGTGNPHYWLDPLNAETITANIVAGLGRVDPINAPAYEANRRAFVDRLRARLVEWERSLAEVQGKPLVAYHNSWAYLARRFRLNFLDFIEPRPGVPPSAAHLNRLIALMRAQAVRVVVRQPQESDRNARFVAERTGAQVVILAASVGAVPEAKDYLSVFDYNAAALAAAFR